ncbi:MAG: hypothetical protein B7Y80_06340 [Hyphomicrobium sp. 32-62-53]|nr:MAG: hypothetical protein B7Z29_05180 [Hyphomicrobium sp. 12-62-95]OYY00250.1 MAG: hypothetical protein B7Y80_06340 [Hyphomicrobium sp. 32-62-53]
MANRTLRTAVTAGLAYVAIAFAAGFALGVLRVTLIAPRLGETAAVLLELPIMLALSWLTCRWVIARWHVPASFVARATMGGLALALLLTAEAVLGTLGLGRTLAEHLASYQNLPERLGLAAQVLFGLFPLLQLRSPD